MTIVELLNRPEAYYHPTGRIEIRETHISWVFLTDRFAYKVKKPVTLFDGILDYSTLDLRKKYCDLEISLNKRLCPDIYLETVPITEKGIEKEPSAEIIDYAVKMLRMPEEGLLQRKLERKEPIPEELIRKIGGIMAEFHANCEEKPEFGEMEKVRRKIEENFETSLQYSKIDEDYMNRVRNFMDTEGPLFSKRIVDGRIRRCHGDFYSNNIIIDGSNIYIFDCVEFTDLFCSGDVGEDVGFLAMDLDYWNQSKLSQYFVDEYVKVSGDTDLLRLLNFFKSYRAFVRGKVADITATSIDSKTERIKEKEKAERYYKLAYSYI